MITWVLPSGLLPHWVCYAWVPPSSSRSDDCSFRSLPSKSALPCGHLHSGSLPLARDFGLKDLWSFPSSSGWWCPLSPAPFWWRCCPLCIVAAPQLDRSMREWAGRCCFIAGLVSSACCVHTWRNCLQSSSVSLFTVSILPADGSTLRFWQALPRGAGWQKLVLFRHWLFCGVLSWCPHGCWAEGFLHRLNLQCEQCSCIPSIPLSSVLLLPLMIRPIVRVSPFRWWSDHIWFWVSWSVHPGRCVSFSPFQVVFAVRWGNQCHFPL